MESKDGRSLLTRTMSFRPPSLSLSARARALRDKFANSKRSMSDSWKDQSFIDDTTTPDVQESDCNSSVQSLIKPYPRKNTSTPTSSTVALAAVTINTLVQPKRVVVPVERPMMATSPPGYSSGPSFHAQRRDRGLRVW